MRTVGRGVTFRGANGVRVATHEPWLHAPATQLAVWWQRATHGPYRQTGDAGTNTPGEWDEITTARDAFMSNPAALRVTATFPDSLFNDSVPQPEWGSQHAVVSAAFHALVTDDDATARSVIEEIIAQTREPSLQWTGDPPFTAGRMNDVMMAWAEWVLYRLHAFDYVKRWATASERDEFEVWLYAAADLFRRFASERQPQLFVDRANDDYTLTDVAEGGISREAQVQGVPYLGGPNVTHLNLPFNNRSSTYDVLALTAGAFLGDAGLIADGKRGFREHLRFGVFPDNTPTEFYRWTDDLPDLGWSYAHYFAGYASAAYALWVTRGDEDMFTHSTSEGVNATAGGPKSLLGVARNLCQHFTGNIVRYASSDPDDAGDSAHQINGRDDASGWCGVAPSFWLPANLYWQDELLDDVIYRRSAPGAYPALPASPAANGPYRPYTGKGGMFPATFLLFAQ